MSDIQIQAIDEEEIDTIIAEDIFFKGKLGFENSLMIKGHMMGDVKAQGDFYIAEGAVVEARIEANIVSVKGTVHGNIFANDRVEIFSCGHVDGDITAPDIIVERGCSFNGICTMKTPGEEAVKQTTTKEEDLKDEVNNAE